MQTRKDLRIDSAGYLNSLTLDELFEKFGITAVRRIDGLDVIGIPVWSATRPLSKTISTSAGKAFLDPLARAGAIAEAIEFHVFENPNGEDSDKAICFRTGMLMVIERSKLWIDSIGPGAEFQTSNGQALGASFEDAMIQALCEVVERDAITLRTHAWNHGHKRPPKVDPAGMPETCAALVSQIESAKLRVMLFHCTLDIPIPVFWAIICDPFGGLQAFAGWGCHPEPEEACNRALLEAIQSRAVYVAGARDDLLRRNIEHLKSIDPREALSEYDKAEGWVQNWRGYPNWCADELLNEVCVRLGAWTHQLYYKEIEVGPLTAVKAIIPGLEGPISPSYRPGPRAEAVCQ
jgi:ribosomal protein S12 methylthiotransferase accessory factor